MSIINKLDCFLAENIEMSRVRLDNDPRALQKIFNKFKNIFYYYYIPSLWGGEDVTRTETINFQIRLGAYSGALAFLQAQSLLPVKFLIDSNHPGKTRLLKDIARGEITIGNAISNSREHSKAKIYGKKTTDGYLLSGTLPFASGFNFFDKILIAFISENNEENYVFIPFQNIPHKIRTQKPYKTIAMSSTNTICVNLENLFIAEAEILLCKPCGWLVSMYEQSAPFAYTLGIVKRACELVEHNHYLMHHTIFSEFEDIKKNICFWTKALLNIKGNSFSSARIMSEILQFSYESVEFCLLLTGGTGLLQTSIMQCLFKELTIWSIPKVTQNFLLAWLETRHIKQQGMRHEYH